MKRTTEDITLSPGIDQAALSPTCLSLIIDMWSDMQTNAVEAVQAPEPNIFSFADSCFFFAIIMQNQKAEGKEVRNAEPQDARSNPPTTELALEDIYIQDAVLRSRKENFAQPDNGNSSRGSGDRNTESRRDFWNEYRNRRRWDNPIDSETLSISQYPKQESDDLLFNDFSPQRQASRPSSDLRRQGYANEFDNLLATIDHEPFTLDPFAHRNIYDDDDETFIAGKAVGIVYLTSPSSENICAGEANVGIIITPAAQGKGLAKQAIDLVLTWALDEAGLHRVQARVLDSPCKDKAISLFTQIGFVHEGIRRRSAYCAGQGNQGMWKDVTYLAVLETDWLMRAYLKPAPRSIWDELFLRHAREREELLMWDNNKQKLKRTSSMETVRVLLDTTMSDSASIADSSDVASIRDDFSVRSGKRRKLTPDPFAVAASSPPPPSESENSADSWESEWDSEDPSEHIILPRHITPRGADFWSRYASSSDDDAGRSSPDSAARTRSNSVSSSHWDILETASGVSSSSFESL